MSVKKKKLLLLGAEGMLGHVCLLKLSDKFLIYATTKQKKHFINKKINIPPGINFIDKIDLTNFNVLDEIVNKIRPNFLVNCAGIINKKIKNYSNINSIIINSLLPHKLSNLSDEYKFRFIHISTDCVFDGKRGNYFEYDKKNANDFYGQTKSIGEEFSSKNSVIIRTSIIGHEIKSKLGLLEWFLKSKKQVSGFDNFKYSGLTTLELQRYILFFLNEKRLNGIYNIGSKSISKYQLLKIIKKVYGKKIDILKNSSIKKNMVLKSHKLKKINIKPQNWQQQINELREFYEKNYK
ncbi:sugar nucleotide-binding protein [Candidatus Pelagibacter sp. HIMB1715]|uniref:sugar nucleotide-binding protein n=1 Tax=Candidatus Pelagibacter sp. HIMB1715 TaxID=3413369 RepID=UPI003F8631AE